MKTVQTSRRLNLESLEGRQMLSVTATVPAHFLEAAAATIAAASAIVSPSATTHDSIVSQLATPPIHTVSTVPANGDVNPYGVAFVPNQFPTGGRIHPGDILVSNFNNINNLQGTGTTIVSIDPSGHRSLFFQGHAGLGLSTALGVLQRGFVIVGNVPTTDGTGATVQQGSLIILNKNGVQVANLTDSALLNGPWDLTIDDEGAQAHVFVSNVLSGTVTRVDLRVPAYGNHITVQSETQIGAGYAHRTDPNALVVGPTGLAYDPATDVLYVASTADNKIFAIKHAEHALRDYGKGTVVYADSAHLRGPVGLVLAPNGDLLATNGDAINGDPAKASLIVEFTKQGKFVGQFQVDTAQGAAFGMAFGYVNGQLEFATVDDATNVLEVWTIHHPKNHLW